jgi:hypothetical protein
MVGLSLSYAYDLPSGPAVVCMFGVGLILAGVVHYLLVAQQKVAALVKVLVAGGAVAGGLWLAFTTAALSSEEVHDASSLAVAPGAGEAVSPAQQAAEALAEIERSLGEPPADAISRLLSVKEEVHRMMATGELKVSEGAVQALARAPEGEAVSELLEEIAYHADDLWVRLRAAEGLLSRGDVLGVEALIELLESDGPPFLQVQASQALERATGQAIAFDPQGDQAGKAQATAEWRKWWEAHRGEPLPEPGG